jgi:hypothetical protein
MTVQAIRTLARERGLKNYGRLKKADLIRALQVQEGNVPCFQAITVCGEQACLWWHDCQGRPSH